MIAIGKSNHRLLLAVGTLSLFVLGCSDDGLDKRYPISGKVTYKGAPVATGTISFANEDPAKHGAQGELKDGYYSLTTLTPGDGALPGKYKVTIESRDIDLTEVRAFVKSKGGNPDAQLPQELVNKARAKAKSNVPEKYTALKTTPLTAEVGTSAKTLDFDLTD
ncbi:hypothetical protein OJF2_55140 [Aquisphaera giovannonii]|uniref:Carboxypeptidase regulatory-like domain-containing protein n=2 Tax=Aquisphaera giovannonii TaxID=406548 RepID=A0A5B9W9L2_9BACT|nr:hypothetical protein OJF2_55140 [Aquisphaera giovannonii]